jgi:hypothetical protein
MSKVIRISIVVFWLACTGWLIRYEAFPERFTAVLPGYKALLGGDLLVVDSWWKLSNAGHPIGYSRSWVELQESNPLEYYVVENETLLNVNIMGFSQRLTFSAQSFLNIGYQLQRFTFSTQAREYRTHIKGERIRGTRFRVAIDSGGVEHVTYVEIPDDTIIYSPAMEMTLRHLAPGDDLTVRSFNPLTQESMLVKIRALRREILRVKEQEINTTVLSISSYGMDLLSWIDSNGRVVRQESPLGVLEASTAEECLDLVLDRSAKPDLLLATAVPCRGDIPNPRHARTLRIRLTGVSFSEKELTTPRQRVESVSAQETVVFLQSSALPESSARRALDPKEKTAALESSAFVQSSDPRIVARAKEIVAGESEPAKIAQALSKWVDHSVENAPSIGLPSSVQVLEQLSGDCNEHTYLYVALARALNLPAKIKVGLVYHEGAFYYHAWPAVYLGEWIEIDPTLGQYTVDATHIALMEGEIKEQLNLARIFGRLKIEVLDVDGVPNPEPAPDA